MAGIIEIRDKKGDDVGILAVDLSHILDLLSKEGPVCSWSILDLYSMGYKEENPRMLEIEQRISNIEEGIPVSWADLKSLAKSCKQIIDAVIVGYKDPAYRPRLSSEHTIKELYKECEIVLELIDSSMWCIYASNDGIIQRFQNRFQDTKLLSIDEIK